MPRLVLLTLLVLSGCTAEVSLSEFGRRTDDVACACRVGDACVPCVEVELESAHVGVVAGSGVYDAFAAVVASRCLGCHDGVDSPGDFGALLRAPDPTAAWVSSPYLNAAGVLEASPIYARLNGTGLPASTMPLGADALTQDELAAVAAFVSSRAGDAPAFELRADLRLVRSGDTLALPTEVVGYAAPKLTIELRNLGDHALQLTDVVVEGRGLAITTASTEIAAGGEGLIELELQEDEPGDYDGVVVFTVAGARSSFPVRGRLEPTDLQCAVGVDKRLETSTNEHLRHAIDDILGVDVADINDVLKRNVSGAVRGRLPVGQLDNASFTRLVTLAESVADVVVGVDAHAGLRQTRAALACAPTSAMPRATLEACARDTFGPMLERVSRDVDVSGEQAELVDLMLSDLDEHGDAREALRIGVIAVLLHPHLVFAIENGRSEQATMLERLHRVHRATLLSVPPLTQVRLARSGALDDEGLAAIVDDILADDAFADRGFRVFAEYYLQKDYILEQLTFRAGLSEGAALSVWQSYLLGLRDIMESNLPLSALLQQDTLFVNRDVAAFMSLPGTFEASFSRVSVPHVRGLARHPAFAAMTARTTNVDFEEPLAPKRGAFWNDMFYCADLPGSIPDDVAVEATPTGGSHRAQFYAATSGTACVGCHALLNPVGFAFQDLDFYGRARASDVFGHAIETSGVFRGHRFDDEAGLAARVVEQSSFYRCFGRHAFTYAVDGLSEQNRCHADQVVLTDTNEMTVRGVFRAVLLSNRLTRRTP